MAGPAAVATVTLYSATPIAHAKEAVDVSKVRDSITKLIEGK